MVKVHLMGADLYFPTPSYPSKCGLAPHPPYTKMSCFLAGAGVAEDSAVSTLAVKQNGAILNDSLLVGPLRVESYPKVTPPPPLYPNMRIN